MLKTSNLILEILSSWNISESFNLSFIENLQNAKIIANYLEQNFSKKLEILDLACGAVCKKGLNYDLNGEVYLPLIAETLAKNGHEVIGIDLRQNDLNVKINYKHISNINLNGENWANLILENSKQKFDLVLFLRSFDTPEIWFYWQNIAANKYNQTNDSFISELILKNFLSQIKQVLKPNGTLIISQIPYFETLESKFEFAGFNFTEINEYKLWTGNE